MNSRCYSDFEHESYLCACSPGFTEERCETGESNVLSAADGRVLFSSYSLVSERMLLLTLVYNLKMKKEHVRNIIGFRVTLMI